MGTAEIRGSLVEGMDFEKLVEQTAAKINGNVVANQICTDWTTITIVTADTFISINQDTDIFVEVITFNQGLLKDLREFFKKLVVPPSVSGKVYVLVSGQGGPRFQSVGSASLPLELDNYEDNVAEDTRHILKDLETNLPSGRMVIFDGAPGTGKTYLVRGLLSEIKNAMFVLIPPDMVGELTNPSLVKSIVQNHETLGGPTVFIIEDADKCLATRGPDNLHILTNLLNLSDGIIGSLCDIRIICTTNARFEDIEEAVLRPGRLCRRIHIGELTRARAMAIYNRLTGKTIDLKNKEYSLAEVYRFARQDGWEPKKLDTSKIVGFKHSHNWDDLK